MGELLLRGPAVRYVRSPHLRQRPRRADGFRSGVRRAAGPGLVLGSSAAIQLSSSVSTGLFGTFGALGTSSLRFAAAAVILLVVARPRWRRARGDWVAIGRLGVVMALMNVAFYQAIARIPLGTAVTVEYLGPLLIAVAGLRRVREVVWVILAAGGVVALSAPFSSASWLGLGFAALAGVGEAGYVLASRAVGARSPGVGGLSLAVGVAAVLTLPFTILAAGSATVGGSARLIVAAGLGIGIAFALEMQAIRRTSAKAVSILFSLDPGVAVLVGAVFLGERVGFVGIAGLTCVIAAGVGVTLDAPPR